MAKLFLLATEIFSLCIAAISIDSADLFFLESFDTTDVFRSGKWVKSSVDKYVGQPINITAGQAPAVGFENDLGVQLTQEMKYYGFGAQFPEPFVPGGKDLVIQYEVKFEESLTCGGAYVKLPRSGEDLSNLNSDTPYTIMFGPDRCGSNNKVHFIVQFQNPISKQWEEKHFNETIPIRSDKKTHLYSLVIRKDSSFEIFIDSVSVSTKNANLLTHMIPSINPPKKIDDPTDSKPVDWVDEVEIDDPNAVKPDDWDESQPRQIPDAKAKKPAGWLDDGPEKIPDPEAKKPEDWDDEEDGEWEAPSVENPACKVGCGVWSPPSISNPLYKGKWRKPKIPNPEYKGPWKARQIDNPDYFFNANPVDSLTPIGGIAVEVWTTNAAILFDNFLVSASTSAAADYAAKTFKLKAAAENKMEKDAQRDEIVGKGGIKERLIDLWLTVVDFFNVYPMALAGTIAAIFVSFFYLVVAGTRAVKPTEEEDGGEDSGAAANAHEEEEEKEREPTSESEPATAEGSDSSAADS